MPPTDYSLAQLTVQPEVHKPEQQHADSSVMASGQSGNGDNATLTFTNWGYRHASRRRFAVRNLSLTIAAGQRVLLLGASGIGKSTILQGAAGLLGSDEGAVASSASSSGTTVSGAAITDADGGSREGSVLVDGVPVDAARGRVGLVLQDPDAQAIFQRLGDNVAFGPENLNVPRSQIWQRVHESLDAVGLGDVQLHRSTTHLSGGQMQRLALAGALAMRPGVLLLDEPTANLDPVGVEQIVGAVRKVLDAHHSTMVLVEHRAAPWIPMIDRVVVLGLEKSQSSHGLPESAEGREPQQSPSRRTVIVADGSPDEVFSDPSIDFDALGIWVPEQYQRAGQRITRIHVQGEPDYPPELGYGDAILETRDLAVGHGHQAIASHIGVDFHPGQITALVGANGAGKSTLALTLAGLLEPVEGKVRASSELQGHAASDSPIKWSSKELTSRISYVFQNPEHQFVTGSVLEEVSLGPSRTGMDEADARTLAMGLLKRFNLDQYARANPYTLSGGEKRRLTVASALAAAPRVLLLDEPTFGQDRNTWMQMVELIQGLRADAVSVIVVTHDRELVTALGARVIELVAERQEQADPPSQANPPTQVKLAARADPPAQVGSPARVNLAAQADPLTRGNPPTQAETAIRQSHRSSQQSQPNQQCQPSLPSNGDDLGIHASHGMTIEVTATSTRTEEPRSSSKSPYLASLNPVYRMFGGMLASIPLLFSLDWVSASVALTVEVVALLAIGFTPWGIVRSTWPVFVGAPGSALAVLLYGKSGGQTWWQWWLIHITDRSAELALATGIRILAIGIPAIICVLGIDATDLADSFSQILHLPDRFVYGGLAGMRLFSVLQDDWIALTASRRSRGLGDDNAVKAFFHQTLDHAGDRHGGPRLWGHRPQESRAGQRRAPQRLLVPARLAVNTSGRAHMCHPHRQLRLLRRKLSQPPTTHFSGGINLCGKSEHSREKPN